MCDFKAIFDIIDQFEREHPEYVRAREIWEQTQKVIAEYEKAINPPPQVITSDHTLYPTTGYILYPPTPSNPE